MGKNSLICSYCERRIAAGMETIDHVIPLSRGGENKQYNKIIACKVCNNWKAALLLDEWRIIIRNKIEMGLCYPPFFYTADLEIILKNIERLIKSAEGLHINREWISFEDRMPVSGQMIGLLLVVGASTGCPVEKLIKAEYMGGKLWDECGRVITWGPTKWMRLTHPERMGFGANEYYKGQIT